MRSICVPGRGKAKGVVPRVCLELNGGCLPLAGSLAVKVVVTLCSAEERRKNVHIWLCAGEARSG